MALQELQPSALLAHTQQATRQLAKSPHAHLALKAAPHSMLAQSPCRSAASVRLATAVPRKQQHARAAILEHITQRQAGC